MRNPERPRNARIAEGAMAGTTGELSVLFDRPTTSLSDAVAQALM
ncbi:hypothetical protein AB0E63_05435 [Kribbella sp. NPDC026596]